MAKIAYWIIIFFITLGICSAIATGHADSIFSKLGLEREVVKAVHQSTGIDGFLGATTVEYKSGLALLVRPFSWESILCLPGILFPLILPATLIVFGKQLRNRLQTKASKLIVLLIVLISLVSLAITVKLMEFPF